MNDTKNYRAELTGARRSAEESVPARGKGEGWEGYSSWVGRAQKGAGRHGAITRNLNSWNNYKSWADKVRSSWDEK